MEELVEAVERFYELLGPRNWILHDRLNFEVGIKGLLDLPADQAEKNLISQYRDRDQLRTMVAPLRRFAALRDRMEMIDRAMEHYEADRFDAVALTLIPVMDGFVNDFEPERRRGLHARETDELAAWDSVVGHHMGLSSAHRTFTKSFRKLSTEPVYELYRNGIVHGMLTGYNNVVVATKAWNRLFAVADWATAREKQAKPAQPESTWSEVFQKVHDTAEMRRESNAFRASVLQREDPAFAGSEHLARSTAFLEAWQSSNYGAASNFVGGRLRTLRDRRRAGQVRDALDLFPLESFDVTAIRRSAVGACDVDVTLSINGEQKQARLRWIREGVDGQPGPSSEDDRWVLYIWEPMGAIGYRARTHE